MSNNTINSVKWVSIRPSGKTADYKSGDKLEFEIPRDTAFIDGKQSYIYVEVENKTTFTDSGATADYPACWYSHMGANGLLQRVQLQDANGKMLEDVEQANAYMGIMNSYGKDQGEYETTAKVEGVAGHDPTGFNSSMSDPKVNIMYPEGDTSTGPLVGGNVAVQTSYCLPVPLGLWSGLGNDHQVFPNLALNGTKMNIYFENPNVCMKDMAHRFTKEIDGSGFFEENFVNVSEDVECDNHDPANPTDELLVKESVCNTAVHDKGEGFILNGVGFRQGQKVIVSYDDGSPQTLKTTITEVKDDEGTSSNQLMLTLADSIAASSTNISVKLSPPVFDYNINKVELRVLECMPNDPKPVLQAVARGINYNTTTLSKLSTASQLKHSVLNIISSMTRASSIWVLPCNAEKLTTANESSIVYPQQDDNNTTTYQFQIKDFLIPNKEVLVDKERNNTSDNSIYRQQLAMATRSVFPLRAFGCGDNPNASDLSNPFFIGVQLAPTGNTFNLLDNEVQLRLTNGSTTDTPARLYHIYVNHTRTLKSGEMGAEVSI